MKLLSYGMKRVSVFGDGNCGYRAVSFLLFGTQGHHSYLRLLVCEVMLKDPNYWQKEMAYPDRKDFLDRVEQILKEYEPTERVELRAISKNFQIGVEIITPCGSGLTVETTNDEALKNGSIALAFVSTNHSPTGKLNHFDAVIQEERASQTSPVPGLPQDFASDAQRDAEAFDAESQSCQRAVLAAKLAKHRPDQNQREAATGDCGTESFAAAAPESLAASKGGPSKGSASSRPAAAARDFTRGYGGIC